MRPGRVKLAFRPGLIALLLSALFPGRGTLAQESEPTAAVESGGESEARRAAGEMEQVIVTGQRSIGSLIREGAELTEDFYMRLNEVIDRDDFRINCWSEPRANSNIPTRVCRTRFQERLMNRAAVSLIQGIENNEDGLPVWNGALDDVHPEMMAMMQEFEAVLLDAVNTDVILNQQVIRMLALKAAVENYETPRSQRRRERRERSDAEVD